MDNVTFSTLQKKRDNVTFFLDKISIFAAVRYRNAKKMNVVLVGGDCNQNIEKKVEVDILVACRRFWIFCRSIVKSGQFPENRGFWPFSVPRTHQSRQIFSKVDVACCPWYLWYICEEIILYFWKERSLGQKMYTAHNKQIVKNSHNFSP